MPGQIVVRRQQFVRRAPFAAILGGTTVIATGAGGVVMGGSATVTTPGAPLAAHTATGGAVAGGTAGIVRSAGRTARQPGERRWTFRYELLDSSNGFVADLTHVISGSVSQNWFADVKRKASFRLREYGDVDIDFLSQRIKPYARLHLPPYAALDYVEWPMGVFLLSSPTRSIDAAGAVTRDVDGYDQLQVLLDDRVDDRYTVSASTAVTDAVTTLLGSLDAVVTTSAATPVAAMEWDPGTSKLTIINNLLSSVNYQSLSFDEDGRAVVEPYISPTARTIEYVYEESETSLLVPEAEQDLDLFHVPNKWVLVVSNPDQDLLISTYTNSNPASPTSTVRRGRTIVDYRTEQDAVDQATLDAKAERLAFNASQIYESITWSSGLNPTHSGNDVYRLRFKGLAINSPYSEAEWSLDLAAGAVMTHRARRVVSI